MRRLKPWVAAPAIAIALLALALVYPMALRPARATAYLTLQVNPSFELGLNREQMVVSAEGLDEEGKAVLMTLDVRNQPLEQALAILIDRLIEVNKVRDGGRIVLALRAVDDGIAPALPDVATRAGQIVADRIARVHVRIETVSVEVDDELYRAAVEHGFLPAAYAELIPLGLTNDTVLQLLALTQELGIPEQLFREESRALVRAFQDLREAGLTEEAALAVIRAAIEADPTLEEVSTIVAGIIDLLEAGIPHEQGFAILALQKDAELQLTPEIFLEEVTTLMAALIDLHEVGISDGLALAVIRAAAQADPTLEEVDTIVSAVIELTERGLAPEEAFTLVKAALMADPTLNDFEEFLGIDDDDDVQDDAPIGDLPYDDDDDDDVQDDAPNVDLPYDDDDDVQDDAPNVDLPYDDDDVQAHAPNVDLPYDDDDVQDGLPIGDLPYDDGYDVRDGVPIRDLSYDDDQSVQ